MRRHLRAAAVLVALGAWLPGCSPRGARPAGADGPADDERPCGADADCALTWVARGACCPLLCAPRAVTGARAAALETEQARCGPCPSPACAGGGPAAAATCEGGRCVVRAPASACPGPGC